MTIYVLLTDPPERSRQDYIDEVRFIEGKPLEVISARTPPFRSPGLEAGFLSSGDCIHVRTLFDLGGDLATVGETIRKITDLGVRIVVAELDGFEFRRGNAKSYTDLLLQFTVDEQPPEVPPREA